MFERKDWTALLTDASDRLKKATIDCMQFKLIADMCEKELKKYPAEPMLAEETVEALEEAEKEIEKED